MEMRKQGEGQGTARSASKAPVKKQSREQDSPTDQSASENQQATQRNTSVQNDAANGGADKDQRSSNQPGDQKDLLQHAKQAGGEIVNQVQKHAGSQLNNGKEMAATEISHVANAVRRIHETLGQPDSGAIARYAAEYSDMAANRIEQFGNYIREKDPKELFADVQNFGRRRPAVLLGGAFLLGFAGARLIKSSMDSVTNAR